MKLERRFDWKDTESIYKAVDENECEAAAGGRVRFSAVRIDGRKFVGVGYPSSVADMADAKTGFWKLEENPRNPKYNRVVSCNAPPLAVKQKASGKA